MDLDQLIRDADPSRGLSIQIPDSNQISHDDSMIDSRLGPRWRTWLGAWTSGRLAPAGAVLAVIAVVAVVVAFSGHHRATTTNGRVSIRSTPAPSARTSPLPTTPAAVRPFVKILAVLRRPQTPADRDDPGLKSLVHNPLVIQGTPVLSAMRLATTTPAGTRVFLIPFRPARHFTLPKGISPTSPIAPVLRRRAHQARVFLNASGGSPSTVAAIKAGAAWTTSGPHPSQAIILVPDGVARVSIAVPTSTGSHKLRRIFAPVHNNIAAFIPATPIETVRDMIWYGESGKIIKRTSRAD
jgi:hypothetical protein